MLSTQTFNIEFNATPILTLVGIAIGLIVGIWMLRLMWKIVKYMFFPKKLSPAAEHVINRLKDKDSIPSKQNVIKYRQATIHEEGKEYIAWYYILLGSYGRLDFDEKFFGFGYKVFYLKYNNCKIHFSRFDKESISKALFDTYPQKGSGVLDQEKLTLDFIEDLKQH